MKKRNVRLKLKLRKVRLKMKERKVRLTLKRREVKLRLDKKRWLKGSIENGGDKDNMDNKGENCETEK